MADRRYGAEFLLAWVPFCNAANFPKNQGFIAYLKVFQTVSQFPYVLCYNIYVILLSALRLEHFSRIIQISLNFSVVEKKDKLTQEDVFIHGYSGHVGYTQQSCGV